MKIISLHMDGFGIFHRKDIDSISPGVTVFYGPNEAGKSTLMAFVKAVLYGFPSRGADQYYPPQVAGRHGGSIRIQKEDGVWTVERYSGKNALKVTRPDGQLGGADDLRRLLCYSTETVFKNIFSFGLTELQDFKTLSADEIREKIFSSSISGTGPSAREALDRLQRKANEILSPRSRSTQIAALMSEFKEIEMKIRDAKSLIHDYESLIRQQEALLEEIQKLNLETEKIRREHSRIQLLLDLWPDWNQKKRLEEEMERLGEGPIIPREVQLRVQQCLHKLETEEQKRAEWVTDLEAKHREVERSQPDVQLLEKEDKIRRLSQEIPLYRSNQERLRQLLTRQFEAEALVRDVLMDLGDGWDESKVMGLNISIPTQEQVREIGHSLRLTEEELKELEQRHQSCLERMEELQRQIEGYERAIEESSVSAFPGDFSESEKLIRKIRSNFIEKKRLLDRIDFLKNQIEERRNVLECLKTEVDHHLIPIVTMPILSFLAAGCLIFSAWRWIRFDYIQALIAGVFGFIFTLLLIIILRVQIRAKKKNEKDTEQIFKIQALNQKMEEEILEATKKSLRLQEEINEYCKKLGKDEGISEITEIDLIETEWFNQKTIAERNSEKRELLANAKSNQAQLYSQKESLVAQITTVRDRLIDLESKFSSWKSDAGLAVTLSPEGVLQFFEKIRLIRERISQRDLVKSELKDTERSIQEWESHLVELGFSNGQDPIEYLTALTSKLENEIRKRNTMLYRQAEVRELEVKIESAQRRIDALKIELDQIFSEMGVRDQYEFENQVARSIALEKSQEQLSEIELRFLNRLGSKHSLEKLIEEFETGSLESWQIRSEELESRLNELQSRRDIAIGEAKAISVERERLEKSSDLQALELDRARVISEIEQASIEWARLQCAKGLIEEALTVFEKEHQPKVLLQASQIFSKVTEERYERVVQGDRPGEVVVIDARGVRKENHQLSRGTAEQLYLALRLGLAHSFSLRQGALPIFMDDVCVNFDPKRTEQMIRTILDFGQNHQIFYFTCQPWIRDLFTHLSPKVEVRELQGESKNLTQSALWGEDLLNTQRS